ncbi:MAG: DUF1573 domain-containing protein [Bacteroides sp.]|nr:DUF1573 domain-containing protein [Bacteroides sp.]MDE7471165.1 DUF1573 domain-containing protein [Paramuribaculum sp.]
MRKHIIISLLLLLTIAAGSLYAKEKAEIAFSTTTHDFGRISAEGGKVSCKYEFTNKGKEQLVIIHVTNGGCGCTTPTFTREPIAPGKTGYVMITFDPKRFKGEFNRTVTVTTNASNSKTRLKFSGYITD